MPKHLLKALIAQLAGLILAYSLARNGFLPWASPFALALSQGLLAACAARLLNSPKWWLYIHFCFAPAVALASQAHLPAWLYGALFISFSLIYWSSFRTQVPLFLSNRVTVHRLAAHLPGTQGLRILDAGSGTGTFVRQLARLRPDWLVCGLESAPAPYWISRWLTRQQPNASLIRGDIWQHSFKDYEVVYAFLSPVPMEDLWRKARKEMRAGTLLISNSFPIPNQKPETLVNVDDRRATQLFFYRIPPGRKSNP